MSEENIRSPNPAAAAAAVTFAQLALPDRSQHEISPPNNHQLGFDFPRLHSDGSTHSLTSHSSRVYEQTPPAALSSLGIRAKMMQPEMHVSQSTSSLADSQYDMIDDLSEISDDHETASLASNDPESTPEGESEYEAEEQDEEPILTSTPPNDPYSGEDYIALPSPNVIEPKKAVEAERQHDIKRENDLLDSYMSDDLETPRQSTLTNTTAKTATSMKERVPSKATNGGESLWLKLSQAIPLLPTFGAVLLVFLPYALLFALRFTADHPSLSLAVRRESLHTALTDTVGTPISVRAYDVEHLLPQVNPECVVTDIFGRHSISPACEQDVRYQGLSPNHMIVAFPGYGQFPGVISTQVIKSDGRKIAFNRTELIEGIHAITFDTQEAHGVITVNMATKKPAMDVQASHNYGSRILQLKTYENAGTDVSNAVSKEVAIMKDAAKTLTGKVSTELKVGYRATKSITTGLALAVSRDLQVFANTAVTAFGKAAKASNDTATALTKDLVLLQQDLVKFSQDLSTTVTSAIKQAKKETKTVLRNPLARSREHLFDLGHALGSFAAQQRPGNRKVHPSNHRPKAENRSSRKPGSNSKTSISSTATSASLHDESTQPPHQSQAQDYSTLQQLDSAMRRRIKQKAQEFRETGRRSMCKEIRGLKKEQKQRKKALKKLAKGLKHR